VIGGGMIRVRGLDSLPELADDLLRNASPLVDNRVFTAARPRRCALDLSGRARENSGILCAAMVLTSTPVVVEGLRGFRYQELPEALLLEAAEWLRRGFVPDAEEIRPGRVYRAADYVVKIYGPGHSLKDRFRPSPAVRSARWHGRALPVRTPRPFLALEQRSGRRLLVSLLLMENVPGVRLYEVWEQEPEAVRALPRFLAHMHHHRVYHGDFHLDNLLWNRQEWVLIDLDGLRSPRRVLLKRPLIERQWAKIHFSLGGSPAVRELFGDYMRDARWRWSQEGTWRRILRRSQHMERRRRARGAA